MLFLQSWEEMTAAGLNMLNYMGPLRKNKNTPADDDPSIDVAPFDFERFKRHLTGLLERVSRLLTQNDQKTNGNDNDTDDTLAEEDDTVDSIDNPMAIKEEQSDWIFDVQKTMDVLPRLQAETDNDDAKASSSKDEML